MKISDDLRQCFGDYQSQKNDEGWEGVKSRIKPGDSVTGEVVARFRFGVFVDLGVGFPALLEVTQVEQRRPYGSRHHQVRSCEDALPNASCAATFEQGLFRTHGTPQAVVPRRLRTQCRHAVRITQPA